MEDIVRQILVSRVYEMAIQTPMDEGVNLSANLGNQVYFKREDLQPVFSFKLRGAYNKISALSDEEKKKGVIAASAGNHAQGVAMSAKKLGISAVIVMPRTTPAIKIRAVEKLGADVILFGDNYSEAAARCMEIIEERGLTFIHPFDDEQVIAGQGTVGHEILQQLPRLDAVYVPVGGGGLIAGVAAFLKAIRPEIRIIGVEPVDSDAMKRSLQAHRPITLDSVGIFADGVAVKRVGDITFEYCKKYVDDIITVTTDEICSAIKAVYEDTRSIVEPAGALATAGLIKDVQENNISGKTLVAINSGANMNFERLQFVAERTRTGQKKEALFAVTIPEKPGALREFCKKFTDGRAITEFNYRYMPGNEAHIFVGIGTEKPEERDHFYNELSASNYLVIDMTDNELAKTHIRHMVGGRSEHTHNEYIYRFRFPERPGALTDFLNAMSSSWNISLFHYRMHGGDFGRVLIGLEIPDGEIESFREFLKRINYDAFDETENPAYRMFL